jgi:hypothetical protein
MARSSFYESTPSQPSLPHRKGKRHDPDTSGQRPRCGKHGGLDPRHAAVGIVLAGAVTQQRSASAENDGSFPRRCCRPPPIAIRPEKARADKAEWERDEARAERDALITLLDANEDAHRAAEANLAAANKQIEDMRGAREQALEEAAQVADARKGPREDYGYDAGFNNACEFIARAIRARTALSHEAHNG